MSELFGRVPPSGASEDQPAASRRSERRHREKSQKRRRRRHVITAVLVVVGLAAVGIAGYKVVLPLFQKGDDSTASVDDYPGPGTGSVEITVHPGDSGSAIARTLAAAGVVATEGAFVNAYRANPNSTKIQAATYQMRLEMKASEAVDWLLNTKNQVHATVLVKEGQRSWEIYATIAQQTGIPEADVTAAAADTASLGLPEIAGGDIEGWLFPATYTIGPNDTATEILTQMVTKTKSELTRLGVPDDQREDVLTKASIVERETRASEDRAKAARLIENRLAINMELQMDSTVAYFTRAEGRVTTTPEERATPDPHNTYLNKGLPSGPICSPGAEAINAVLHPADGNWLYMLTVDQSTGETKFFDTYEEFEVARVEWASTSAPS